MNISPFAGKPAEQSILVNVPKLVTAYCTDAPDFILKKQLATEFTEHPEEIQYFDNPVSLTNRVLQFVLKPLVSL